eukprot:CAMPEP_0113960412 /NCGR_PEP_ID=MMETSP0011_2-20120614/4695_1 /TAXON_ID=101924 /ORGANISM="Rhodosorus marinus" /LENGTH=452 /DNA_ID=CAMNT_0000971851 /DNA_START=199 /DNA_END=1557 /DNA_ORIENTATION=+ /assembly_acc=CAM_ASM_000156
MGVVISTIARALHLLPIRRLKNRLLGREHSSVEKRIENILVARAKGRPSSIKSLNSLLLKLSTLEQGFDECRRGFHNVDTTNSNTISYEELREAASKQGFATAEDDLQLIFAHSDIDGQSELTFREFLITLMYLNLVEEKFHLPTESINQAFDIAVDAFLYFDKEGTGVLKKEEVIEAAFEQKEGLPDSMKKRFEEMDADGSGIVTLGEFVYTLSEWAGVSDAEIEDEGDEEYALDENLHKASFNSRASLKTLSVLESDEMERSVRSAIQERAKTEMGSIRSADALLMKLPVLTTGFNTASRIFEEGEDGKERGLEYTELGAEMERLGYKCSDKGLVEKVLLFSDADNRGVLSAKEFVLAQVYLMLLEPNQDLVPSEVSGACTAVLDAFKYFDTSGEGDLDRGELLKGFRSEDGGSPNLIVRRFEEMDLDHSGVVSLDEFFKAVYAWSRDEA